MHTRRPHLQLLSLPLIRPRYDVIMHMWHYLRRIPPIILHDIVVGIPGHPLCGAREQWEPCRDGAGFGRCEAGDGRRVAARDEEDVAGGEGEDVEEGERCRRGEEDVGRGVWGCLRDLEGRGGWVKGADGAEGAIGFILVM